jgi:pimeloyl-ACP methyl ester carboxylesterase
VSQIRNVDTAYHPSGVSETAQAVQGGWHVTDLWFLRGTFPPLLPRAGCGLMAAVAAPLVLHRRSYGTGPRPVLALHCSLAHGGAWRAVATHLRDCRLLAPDLPGHGMSPDWAGPGDYHAATTRAVVPLLQDLAQRGPVDLLGHSFGATVALRLALERPDLVRSLMLVEPVLFAAARAAEAPEYGPWQAQAASYRAALAKGNMALAADLFQALWGAVPLQALPAPQRGYIIDRIGLIAAQDGALTDDTGGLLSWQRLESLGLPVLLVEGGLSPPIIGAIQTELARRLPMVRRVTVEGAGHMLPLTHPGPLARALNEQLAHA